MSAGFFANGSLTDTPKRIVSLVPSQTELLFDLGLREEVVGITKFCIHPQVWFQAKARVGGTKTVDIGKVKSLGPDFIIANKEENSKVQIEALSEIAPVWVSDIETLEDALSMIAELGNLTHTAAKANEIIQNINAGFTALARKGHQKTVAYLIWRNPWMAAASGTFIHHLLVRIGFKNIFRDELRYPGFTLEHLKELNPDLVFLSSEPFPFKEKHAEEIRSVLPNVRIVFVDGEMFSWYGSRLQLAPAYFNQLLME